MASKEAVELRSLSDISPTKTEANSDDVVTIVAANESRVEKDTNPQTLLRNELENFAEGQARRIALHVDNGANVKHRYGDGTAGDELTTLHVLFDAFSKSSEDDKTKRRSCVESLHTLLDLGADPTARDHNDRSVLQTAVANLCPVNLLEILLSSDRDVGGDSTLLYDLLKYGKAFYMVYVEILIDKDTDLELTSDEQNTLELMAGIEDKGKSLITLVEQKRPQMLRKHANSMLRQAVKSGSLETVKFLLNNGATVPEASQMAEPPLIILAATTSSSSFEKFSLLLDLEADVKETDSKSRNVLHHAALSRNLGIMRLAVERGVSPQDRDDKGNLPIHFACESGDVKCLEFFIQKQSPVNEPNEIGQSCLHLALEKEAKMCVERLIKAGATFDDSRIRDLRYDKVTLLADHRVIRRSPKPIEMTLRLATLYYECAQRDELHRLELQSLSKSMQSLAVEMMDKAHWTKDDITDDLFEYGMENQQKMFIASVPVQENVKTSWYGQVRLKNRQYTYKVFLFLAKAFILPFVFAFCLCCLRYSCLRKRYTEFMKVDELIIVYIANAVAYLLFVLLLVVNVSLKSIDIPATSPSNLDWIVLVFVVALALQEIAQALSHRRKMVHYATDWSNILDLFLCITFISYYILLFVGYYAMDDGFQVIRASFHLFGFASLLSTNRLLWYLKATALLGPIQLSFFGIFYDVVLFLSVLLNFLIGFAVCITSVYSAPVKSLGAPENATMTVDVSGMWPSLKILFWSLFGMIDLSSFEAERDLETAVGTVLLALWLVLAVIVLLNMLIALISDAFQKVQDNADMEWKFARAVIIHDITKSLPIPIPINIFHLIALFVLNVQCTRDCCQAASKPSIDPADHKEVRRKLREKIAEAEGEECVQKRDLVKLKKHLDKQISVPKSVVQPEVVVIEFAPDFVSEGSESEESDDDGLHSFLRRRMMSLQADIKSKQSKTEAVSGRQRKENKGSRSKGNVDVEEKSLSGQLKSSGDSNPPGGATQEDSAKELLKRLRHFQENFQASFQKLQSEFLELQSKATVAIGRAQ